MKTVGGFRRTRFIGLGRTLAAYTLVRIARLVAHMTAL